LTAEATQESEAENAAAAKQESTMKLMKSIQQTTASSKKRMHAKESIARIEAQERRGR